MKSIAPVVTAVPELRGALRVSSPHRTSRAPPPMPRRRCLTMGNRSCTAAAKVKAQDQDDGDGDAPRPKLHEPKGKEGGAEQGRGRSESEAGSRAVVKRSDLRELFKEIYVCAYVCCWRLGELVAVNAQEAFRNFRRDFLEKLGKKQ